MGIQFVEDLEDFAQARGAFSGGFGSAYFLSHAAIIARPPLLSSYEHFGAQRLPVRNGRRLDRGIQVRADFFRLIRA